MTYAKALEAYPDEFRSVIEAGALQGFTIPLPSPAEASRLRGRLYAFKGVLKKEAHKPDATEEIKQLYALSNKCQIRVEGSLLVLRPLDQDPDAMLIAAALKQIEEGPAEPSGPAIRPDGTVLVPINPAHLPPWLAQMAVKRSEPGAS